VKPTTAKMTHVGRRENTSWRVRRFDDRNDAEGGNMPAGTNPTIPNVELVLDSIRVLATTLPSTSERMLERRLAVYRPWKYVLEPKVCIDGSSTCLCIFLYQPRYVLAAQRRPVVSTPIHSACTFVSCR
jgi:hypothetical protein